LGFGGIFSSLGGKYLGPILADVVKSIQGAQRGGSASKRKNMEGNSNRNGLQSTRRKKRIFDDDKGILGRIL
jgi:hypothetical protein